LFLVHAFQQLIEAYGMYFSYAILFLISIPIAIVRTYQVLYKHRMGKMWHAVTEIAVELARLVQYIIVLAKGTDTAIRSLFSSGSAWGAMFAGIRLLHISDAVWEFVGFIVVFTLYNAVLYALFHKSFVAALMNKWNINPFEVNTMQSAVMVAFKNMLLIPVSVIYIFQILRFI
jgi:hypothetical protein